MLLSSLGTQYIKQSDLSSVFYRWFLGSENRPALYNEERLRCSEKGGLDMGCGVPL